MTRNQFLYRVNNRLTIKVLFFYYQPIVMVYCQRVNDW